MVNNTAYKQLRKKPWQSGILKLLLFANCLNFSFYVYLIKMNEGHGPREREGREVVGGLE